MVDLAGPDRVAVTVYRDPDRDAGDRAEPALAERLRPDQRDPADRRFRPANRQIRFEGVAGGILPQSAIVTGFPDGIVERNRDAYLLSPATLLDRSLGRRVHLRRTSRATGAVREQEAVIRSGADGAVVLETAEGFEALRCTGLPETLVYDGVPPELSARPTLSVRTRASRPVTATVTLSYLASGFDWQANYVAQLSPDGSRIDLFAWLTLASSDETSFPNADTQAVAGNLNREQPERQPREGGPLDLHAGRRRRPATSRSRNGPGRRRLAGRGFAGEDSVMSGIVVTGTGPRDGLRRRVGRRIQRAGRASRRIWAISSSTGSPSRSRSPPTPEAGRLAHPAGRPRRPGLPPARSSRARRRRPTPVPLFLVTRNRTRKGSACRCRPAPVALFAERRRPADPARRGLRRGPRGRRGCRDRARRRARRAHAGSRLAATPRRWRDYRLIVTNDRPRAVRFEAEFEVRRRRFPSRRPARAPRRPAALGGRRCRPTAAPILRYRVRVRDEDE